MNSRFLIGLALCATALPQNYSTNRDEQLGAYIAEALERNPAVKESFARHRAALQRLPQVSALPDPTFGVTQYARTPETRVGPQTTMLSITQRLPWFGKLSDREKLAAREASVLREMHEAAKAEVVRRVKLAYYDLAYVDRAVAITGEDLELLRHYEVLAQARYSQGVGLQQAAVKLQAEITRDLNRLETLKRQRVDAEAVLSTLMDRPADTPLARVALPKPPAVELNYEQLFELARRRRPEINAAFRKIESEEKRIHLARQNYKPDFTLGASFVNVLGRRDPPGVAAPPTQNGKNIFSFSVGVSLPIFRRKYDAGVLEAVELFHASRESYRNQVNQAEVSIRSAGFRLETIERQMALFENALLPQTEQALASTEAAYSTGQLSVLELLDSERMLLEVRLGLAQLAGDYMKSLAEVERAVGAAFPEMTP